jgi:hypothetical protein
MNKHKNPSARRNVRWRGGMGRPRGVVGTEPIHLAFRAREGWWWSETPTVAYKHETERCHHRKRARACSFSMEVGWWWWKVTSHHRKRARMLIFEGGWLVVVADKQPPSKTSRHARFRGWLTICLWFMVRKHNKRKTRGRTLYAHCSSLLR